MTVKHYTTYGPVRNGCGHRHRTVEAAMRCLRSDGKGCQMQGGYSDRTIYARLKDGSLRGLTEEEHDSIRHL